ncbi:MAG: ComEC/Rec2 family competence protein [Candidatus Latescibacteria bacterium]|nr:ComEC/Rec2 family competence protein [Candidatus Latescibacterota bacterium]
MFWPLLLGVLLGLPLRLTAARAALPLYWPLLLLPSGLPPKRGRLGWTLRALGVALVLLRLPGAPAQGEVDVAGRWDAAVDLRGERVEGRLRARPELPLRLLLDVDGRLPADGARWRGRGLLLPTAGGEAELRVREWTASRRESPAARASRAAGPGVRGRLARRLTRGFPAREAPLARALLLGERRGLPASTWRRFRDAGLAHVLALSGLHAGLFLLLARRLIGVLPGGGAAGAERVLLLALPLLLLLWGGSASVLRALAMAAYVLVWRRRGGRPRAREALALAALVEFMRRPATLLSPGFQLSYLATLALIAWARRVAPPQAFWPRLRWSLAQGLLASLLCTAAGLPVLIGGGEASFGRLALLGPLWNLAAGPLCALSLGLGWLALPFAALPGVDAIAAAPGALALRLLAALAFTAGGPLAVCLHGRVASPWVWIAWSLGFRTLLAGGRRRWPALLMGLPLLVLLVGGA